jgi:hypothetical protein
MDSGTVSHLISDCVGHLLKLFRELFKDLFDLPKFLTVGLPELSITYAYFSSLWRAFSAL